MSLELPDGTAAFIDANIFYYHYVETPPLSQSCTSLLQRAAKGQIRAFSSVHVLAEAIHKIMLTEAATQFGLQRAGLVNWLQRHRGRITELSLFLAAARELLAGSIQILTIDPARLPDAAEISARHGLLTNDAITVALLQHHSLEDLVTNDDDFDAIPGLKVWKPR